MITDSLNLVHKYQKNFLFVFQWLVLIGQFERFEVYLEVRLRAGQIDATQVNLLEPVETYRVSERKVEGYLSEKVERSLNFSFRKVRTFFDVTFNYSPSLFASCES